MYKTIRDHRENAKSINFWGKSVFVDISSTFSPMSIMLGCLLDAFVLHRLSLPRMQSVTISGL
jgi:hypothetical protein